MRKGGWRILDSAPSADERTWRVRTRALQVFSPGHHTSREGPDGFHTLRLFRRRATVGPVGGARNSERPLPVVRLAHSSTPNTSMVAEAPHQIAERKREWRHAAPLPFPIHAVISEPALRQRFFRKRHTSHGEGSVDYVKDGCFDGERCYSGRGCSSSSARCFSCSPGGRSGARSRRDGH
jgi:hypothetical protein